MAQGPLLRTEEGATAALDASAVAMELTAALHHSRDGGRVTNYGLRALKTASSGGVTRWTFRQRKRTTCFLEKLDQDISMAILMRLAVAQQPATRKQMNLVC